MTRVVRLRTLLPRLAGPAAVGLLAGAAVAFLEVVFRVVAGIPLPAELGADRVLPMIPVNAFLNLLGRMGGPIAAKEQAFWGGFAGIIGATVAASVIWELLRHRKRGGRLVLGALAVIGVSTIAGLGPVLASNYAGAPIGDAIQISAGGLLVAAVLAAVFIRALETPGKGVNSGRRNLLLGGAGLALTAATGVIGGGLFRDGTFGYDGTRLLAGTGRKPITPVADFYTVTKNLVDPNVDPAVWRLEVTGAVREPFTLTLAELRTMPGQVQETTLECISNGVAYGLLSNGLWGGVPLSDMLARAMPTASAKGVVLQGVDGYRYSLSLDRALSGQVVVAHSMNGEPLIRRHGAPARAVVPGAYGEASAKWLTQVRVTDQDEPGYYAEQGWRSEFVHTTSVIDIPSRGQVLLAGVAAALKGVAFAGDRGISRVEISPDGGQSWLPARIDYSQSPLAWALWSADWTPSRPGAATLSVRAYDGAGKVQEALAHGFVPSGSTGTHSVEVRVV